MGWLTRVTQLVKKKAKEQPEEILFSQLRLWLQQRSIEAVDAARLKGEAQKYIMLLRERSQILAYQLEQWQQKARQQPSIEEILPFFREARRLTELLQIPGEITLEKLLSVNMELEARLYVLSQKLESSSFAQEFDFLYEKESSAEAINPLLKELLDLDALRQAFTQKLAQSGYTTISALYSKLNTLEQHREKASLLQKEVNAKKSRLQAAEEKRLEKEKELHHLRHNQRSQDLAALKKKKDDIQRLLDNSEMELLSFFSKLKPLLQQYTESSSNTLLLLYLQDPLAALFRDESLSIKHTLHHLKALLKSGKVSLKQEDFIAGLALLENMNEQALEQRKLRHRQLQQELSKIREQFLHNDFVVKLDDAAYRLEHYHKLIAKLDGEIASLEEQNELLQALVSREQEMMKDLIKAGMGKNVVLKA